MKLTSFYIQDYRSIAKATLSDLGSSAILIGPNNEGKSNVLQAINTCLTLLRPRLSPLRAQGATVPLRFDRDTYDWATDYPVSKQTENAQGESVFRLTFSLSEAERVAFQEATKSKINGVLPIELRFGTTLYASFKVLKKGKGAAALTSKPDSIFKFIASTLDFVYIPAVRTADASLEVVNELVNRELRKLENNDKYKKLLAELDALQKPILSELEAKLKENLQGFLGASLKDVSLQLVNRQRGLRRASPCQITIDDGAPTLLERKGDGVQSLVAISLMTGALQDQGQNRDIILLLEEPESHLHPRAIHQLSEVLATLRKDNQLFLTTHCPLLVNRADISSNLIVSNNITSTAKSLEELREVLGVRTSDNLQHAALVLVVEGTEDEVCLRALFTHYSERIGKALKAGSLTFQVLGGASKLPYTLSNLQSSLCNYYVILDDDHEGRLAYQEAKKNLFLTDAQITFAKCLGMQDSEFEDMLAHDIYADHFNIKYGVDVKKAPFDSKCKWSERIRKGMMLSGKPTANGLTWPEKVEYEDKRAVAELVAQNPQSALHGGAQVIFDSLVNAVEIKLDSLAVGQ